MKRLLVALAWLALLVFAFAACSSRRLPAGTPAPEYEAPVVPPWPAEQRDAGDTTARDQDASMAPESVPGAELSPDAGVR